MPIFGIFAVGCAPVVNGAARQSTSVTINLSMARATVRSICLLLGAAVTIGPLSNGRDRGSLAVDPHDLTRLSDDFGREECHITRAAPNIEDAPGSTPAAEDP